jgi:hypothetical protein
VTLDTYSNLYNVQTVPDAGILPLAPGDAGGQAATAAG